jgi:hypothetical protein
MSVARAELPAIASQMSRVQRLAEGGMDALPERGPPGAQAAARRASMPTVDPDQFWDELEPQQQSAPFLQQQQQQYAQQGRRSDASADGREGVRLPQLR